MKKRLLLLAVVASLAWLGTTGCSNKNIDTAKVRAAFPSLSGNPKTELDQGLAAIDAGNFSAAVKPLQRLSLEIKLDTNQRKLLLDAIDKAKARSGH